MPLRAHWRDLDREASRAAPNRPGVIEFGDESGTVLAVEAGVVRDVVKSAVAYREAARVRWSTTHTMEQAETEARSHREP